MSLSDAFAALTADPAVAQRFTKWMSTGDAAGLAPEIAARTRRFVNADPSNVVPSGEWEDVAENVFERPDGTRWEHRVVLVRGEIVFYAQRLARAEGPTSGSFAVADPAIDRIDIWLDAPKAPRSPAGWVRAYTEMLG